jgi:hypothetical protein
MMRAGAILAAVLALALVGCGGGSGDDDTVARVTTEEADGATGVTPTKEHEPGAEGTAHTHDEEEGALGPAATEASPEAQAEGPAESGELSDEDAAAISSVVRSYFVSLNRHAAGRVCALLAPGALDLDELPQQRGGCRRSLRASIGTEPQGGGPAWRRTAVGELEADALGDDRARVNATVTTRFSDRRYVSVEDDVIYLERVGPGWRLAKPSGTLYRAVGYPEPPLTSFTPPPGWS